MGYILTRKPTCQRSLDIYPVGGYGRGMKSNESRIGIHHVVGEGIGSNSPHRTGVRGLASGKTWSIRTVLNVRHRSCTIPIPTNKAHLSRSQVWSSCFARPEARTNGTSVGSEARAACSACSAVLVFAKRNAAQRDRLCENFCSARTVVPEEVGR